MVRVQRTGGYQGSKLWNSARLQVSGVLILAVILPALALAFSYAKFLHATSTPPTIVAISLAACASIYLVRNITFYPGIRGAFFTFPSVMMCFGLIFSIFLFSRVDYSRALLLGSGFMTLVWLYIVQLIIERGPPLHVGIVPFGNVGTLSEVSTLRLHSLENPQWTGDCDILVADFRADLPDEWEAFLADCALAGVPVLHIKQLHEALTGRVEVEHLSENSFGSLIPFIGYLRLRRFIDFFMAIVAGILLLPMLAVVAVLIKLDSPGPLFFRQVRIGYRGVPFRVVKFRTMVAVREAADARADAITRDNDKRITRLGRFLRRTRIDEIPQIINILKGEMSWIGPRPEAEVLSRWYESELPFYRYRHIVPPGITGWAQVNQGHVAELDQVMNKLHYDFYYIKNFSPWLDALIVAKTVQTVVTGFGSR